MLVEGVLKSIERECVIIQKQEGKVLFSTKVYDLGKRFFIGQFHGSYEVNTGKCSCDYSPGTSGQLVAHFEGENGKCEHYPEAGCEVLDEKVIEAADLIKKRKEEKK